MRSFFLLTTILIGCTPPKLTTYENKEIGKGKGVVVNCDFKSGEHFEFDHPGALRTTLRRVIFGKAESGDFRTIFQQEVVAVLADSVMVSMNQLDSNARIREVHLAGGEVVRYDRYFGKYYREGTFVCGKTVGGFQVYLPLERVVQTENLRNLQTLETQSGISGFFTVIGVIGLTVLYVMAKMRQEQ